MALRTTTIGSYPKPDYLRIPAFEPKHPDPTRRYSAYLNGVSEADLDLLRRAIRETVRHQVAAGIDIPTDGETSRSHYVHHHLRHLSGIDFATLSEAATRDGAWTARFPTITGPIVAGAPFLVDDWQCARSATDRPIKMTLPGPMTIIDSTVDAYYGEERRLARDLADALAHEALALAEAGCRHMQIDEPVFARQAEKALDWGIEMLERAFAGLPPGVTRIVHICCGYPSALDLDDFPKAPKEAYAMLAGALDACRSIDCVSIEDAHRHNDLGLLELFTKTSVILGVLRIAHTRIETEEEIRHRLSAALDHIDAERLLAGPDCGLAMLDADTASRKLTNMCLAAQAL